MTKTEAAPAESPLNVAIRIANDAHAGQKDKAGQPYILHPLRVMLRLAAEDEQVVAVLHDVLEDTTVSSANLAEQGIPARLIASVEVLSKRSGEDYGQYLARVKRDPLARAVKLADLEDNLDVRRLEAVEAADAERLTKYLNARAELTAVDS